jgi:ketosteroid isomerase-like protein
MQGRDRPTMAAIPATGDAAMSLRQCLLRAVAVAVGAFAVSLPALGAAPAPNAAQLEAIADQVKAREIAFAQTLADRRLDRFADFVAEDAVFRGAALRIGRATIVEKWSHFFDGPKAPFSWAPDAVTVAADGRTAISTGPVRDPEGKTTSRFITIWRLDADERWRVIVDGGVANDCEAPARK